MTESQFPLITTEPIQHVDATPDADYPLRILRAHRQNCRCKWQVSGLDEFQTGIYEAINRAQDERVKILDNAIAILEARK